MVLQLQGTESGHERWEEPDRSAVEYRAPDGAVLRFEAFVSTRWFVQKRIGAKVTTRRSRFAFAEINSRYWVPAIGQFYAITADTDHDTNDSYLDEYESKITAGSAAAFPERVESLCRAQWRGARHRYVVAHGPANLPTTGDVPDFPTGFPGTWPAPGGFSIWPGSLSLIARNANAVTSGAVTIQNWEGTPQQFTVHPATGRGFQVNAGIVTVAPDLQARIWVQYRGVGHATGSFVVDSPTGAHTIPLQGDVRSPQPNPP